MVAKKGNKIRDFPAAPPAPRASKPVPRIPVDDKPIRVDLPLACEACDRLKKG